MSDEIRIDDVGAPAPTIADSARQTAIRSPMGTPSDSEKYRWIRANRGNFAIVEALGSSNRDIDFDQRIVAEMGMCAAGRDSYLAGRFWSGGN
jgi:hypothetical protein